MYRRPYSPIDWKNPLHIFSTISPQNKVKMLSFCHKNLSLYLEIICMFPCQSQSNIHIFQTCMFQVVVNFSHRYNMGLLFLNIQTTTKTRNKPIWNSPRNEFSSQITKPEFDKPNSVCCLDNLLCKKFISGSFFLYFVAH